MSEVGSSLARVPVGSKLEPSALRLPEGLTFEQWSDMAEYLGEIAKASHWWVGDWMRYATERWDRGRYAIVCQATGLDFSTAAGIAYVALNVDPDRRRDDLSFSHHREVAALDPEAQTVWLARCAKRGWSVHDFRRQLRAQAIDTASVEAPVRSSARVLLEVTGPDAGKVGVLVAGEVQAWIDSEGHDATVKVK